MRRRATRAHPPIKGAGSLLAPLVATCADASKPTRSSDGSFSCQDGSEPECEDGSPPLSSTTATAPMCAAPSPAPTGTFDSEGECSDSCSAGGEGTDPAVSETCTVAAMGPACVEEAGESDS